MPPDGKGELTGKVAIVTGAAQGIGLGIAETFAAAGATVAVVDLQAEGAEAAAARIDTSGDRAIAVAADVGEEASAVRAIEAVFRRWGRIDVLVNNAGIQLNCASLELSGADLQRVLNVNLCSAFFTSQAAANLAMVPQGGGNIINISSVASMLAFPRRLPYGISKAGINALTRILAAEWAPYRIRVNAIAPGYVRTELVEHASRAGHIDLGQIIAKTPQQRLGCVEEIAGLALYLASADSGFLTGQVIAMDGGFSLTK